MKGGNPFMETNKNISAGPAVTHILNNYVHYKKRLKRVIFFFLHCQNVKDHD